MSYSADPVQIMIDTGPGDNTLYPHHAPELVDDTALFPQYAQVGGGRRTPSPPPILTPTRLCTAVKATARDAGLVRSAQARRVRLLSDQAGDHHQDEERIPECFVPSMPDGNVRCASVLFPADGATEQTSFFAQLSGITDPAPTKPVHADTGVHERVRTEAEQPPCRDIATSSKGGEPKAITVTRARVCTPASTGGVRTAVRPPHSTGNAIQTSMELYLKPHTPRRPASVPPIVDEPETIVIPGTSDEDTPRPAPGTLPTFTASPGGGSYVITEAGTIDLVVGDFPERPDTPSPPEKGSKKPAVDFFADDKVAESSATMSKVGRLVIAILEYLEDGFQKVNDLFNELAGQTGMSFHQVVARFTKQFSRLNSANYWNIYQRYSMANQATELARVAESNAVHSTPSSRLSRCYKLFREEFPETWSDILDTFEEMEAVGGMDQTVSQRQQLFARLVKNLRQTFSGMAKAHWFEGIFIMAGSVVNQDGGLGHVFSTAGAVDFFAERCRADNNDIVGHFKAHIYHKASLTHLASLFEDSKNDGGSAAKKDEGGSAAKKDEGGSAAKKDEGGSAAKNDVEEVEILDPEEGGDHVHVRKAFISALKKVGCQWATGKLFPWKGLPSRLAKSGVVCYNYPDSVPFPGQERQSHMKGGSKGISDLTLPECTTLLAALGDDSKEGLYFKSALSDSRGRLQASLMPVIYGTAPAHNSHQTHGKRMYANLTVDRKGPPRIKNGGTRIKKKGKVRVPAAEVISILDSDEGDKQETSLVLPAAIVSKRVEVVLPRCTKRTAKKKVEERDEEVNDIETTKPYYTLIGAC
ncbi:hypothetical protein L210DRAFT_3654954 [Boletus edulis BED1]|uniref:Uncharacterized protein n=1 Tax=Boletus edulis BED1 TaxID=1328754 RepID=A0AAD4G6C1_BOLED|nr:hypothetical protein L210DRAFT_3654954 [Boletus edulis BED1]